ncbi:MAG: nitroreductase/quinone reductase family protein [Anaerolineales bacterium]|nr:nitroreductase/quinone reductase family protein [Anaerolineales bacterium]
MIRKPNAFQRFLHRFFMLRPVTAFFASRTHRIDGMILKLTEGKHSISEILGWNIVQLTATGAKTGRLHTLPLIGVLDDEKIALIASSFGRQHNPGWYYNLIKNPDCSIQLNGLAGEYRARETAGQEREKYWQMAVSYYAGYEKYKQRAAHRRIPVMVLERVK